MKTVHYEGATKRYGSLTALAGLDLSIESGRVFGLVGPNGAGKTTAIGLLTGLLAPTAGRVSVCGIEVAKDPVAAKRRLGFVPDRPYLWPKWTPRESLRFVGSVFDMRGPSLEERIVEELTSFTLMEKADQRNETLSHGTRQRVALAQAFLHRPEVFVLDEPMVGLDPIAQRHLVGRLRERAAAGATVMLTTHQLTLAEELADEVGLLAGGKLVALGPPKSLTADGSLHEVFFALAGQGAVA